jgi:hypothetical protein
LTILNVREYCELIEMCNSTNIFGHDSTYSFQNTDIKCEIYVAVINGANGVYRSQVEVDLL